jgi:hypothetical protein
MRTAAAVRSLLFSFVLLAFSHGAFAQVGISVGFGPPALPLYAPICPADGYLWVPGYWSYDVAYGYYWVPGKWVQPPQVGLLWTPGYWGWGGSSFVFYPGYWGPQVGYYGGINYGFGYGGVGYEGGRWEGGYFAYNTYVNRVNTAVIHSTYSTTVVNVSENRVSYNGGAGGVEARPTPQQESYAKESHVGLVTAQMQHIEEARNNPELRAAANQGKPPIAATVKPGDFKTGVVASSEAGGEYRAPLPDAPIHASQLQAHKFTPPNTGNVVTDKEYQQQQSKLAAQQAQDHQELEQQQEKEHQQAIEKNYSDAQKQQMEQRHTQQTQQLEQEHAAQQRQTEQRQAPHQPASKPEPH